MSIRHPDFGLIGEAVQHGPIKFDGFFIVAQPALGGGLQAVMRHVIGVERGQRLQLSNRLIRPVLPIEHNGQIGARRNEVRRQFHRPTQQSFGILQAANAACEFGHHADGGNIERVCLQMLAQQRLCIMQAVLVERDSRFQQHGIAHLTGEIGLGNG